jgi:hypothetical protein
MTDTTSDTSESTHEQVELREALENLCAKHEHGATRWQDPLPVPEWIPLVRGVLAAHPAEPAPVTDAGHAPTCPLVCCTSADDPAVIGEGSPS